MQLNNQKDFYSRNMADPAEDRSLSKLRAQKKFNGQEDYAQLTNDRPVEHDKKDVSKYAIKKKKLDSEGD